MTRDRYLNERVFAGPKIGTKGWSEEAIEERRRVRVSIPGTIVAVSDRHGLCFRVRLDDGCQAWFDPDEVNFVRDLEPDAFEILSDDESII
jgi:hypothetical protein